MDCNPSLIPLKTAATRLLHSLLLAGPIFASLTLTAQSPILSGGDRVLPLTFEENRGQAPEGVRYLAHTAHGEMLFTSRQVLLPCSSNGTPVSLLLTQDAASVHAELPTRGVANYYSGNDRRLWLQGIPLNRQIRYQEVAAGVDLVFYGRNGLLEYDLQVAPGAEVDAVHLSLSKGASFQREADGAVTVHLENDPSACQGLRFLAPAATQEVDGRSLSVESRFTIDADGGLGFSTGSYDRHRPLVIDPVVSYTKIIGANNTTTVSAIQVDSSSNVILTGQTDATNYPVAGGGQGGIGSSGSEQVYVTKLDATGTQILYSTYIPAPSFSTATALALDASGNAYVAGIAGSSSFPTTSSNLGVCSSFCNSGFAAKFDTTGAMVYSTFLGSGQQLPRGITVDAGGNAYIAGSSYDNGLKTVNAFQPSILGASCSYCNGPFFGKLNPAGTDWVFSSYFSSPGTNATSATSIARDSQGNFYFAGSGTGVPLKGSLQSGTGGSFVAEFAPDGKTLVFSTLLGGNTFVSDNAPHLQVGGDGTIYLAGTHIAPDFPYTVAAYRHPVYSIGYAQSQQYIFASAINPGHTGYTWSTYLGDGSANATAIDQQGNFYVAGSFNSGSVPFKNPLAADSPSVGAYVLELDSAGNLVNATGFGGRTVAQVPSDIEVDSAGNLYLAGQSAFGTSSNGFTDPINVGTGAAYTDQSKIGSYSTFIAKIAPANQPQISLSYRGPVLELRNAGSADLHIGSIMPGNTITSLGSTCSTTLPAASSCFLTPLSTKPDGALIINSDAQPASQTFTPTGLASSLGAVVYVDSSQLNFPPTQNGTSSAAKPLLIWNLGNASTTIMSVLTFGTVTQTNNCSGMLAPGTYCTAMITINPTTNGQGSYDIGVVYGSGSRIDVFPNFTANPSDGPLVFSTASLNYGNVLLGATSLLRTITVTNSGTSSVAVSASSFSGTDASSFAVTANTCADIPLVPQASCVLGVVFQPMQAGRIAVPMVVSGGGSSATIYGIGTGLSAPSLSVTPTSANLGNVALGSTATQVLQVKNTNTTGITITSINAGAADGGLQPDYTQSNTCGTTLAPNATCTVTVTFSPSAMGVRKGVVTLLIDGGALVAEIPISGTGVPVLAATPVSVAFPSTPVGVKVLQTVTLLNQSGSAQNPVLSTTAPFSIDSTTCTASLTAGGMCMISVAFQPSSNGPQAGVLTVASGNAVPLTVPLSGTATVSAITLSPAALTFGTTSIGTTAAAQVVTVTNAGAAPLTTFTFGFAGANPNDFSLASNCGASLAVQQSCALNIVFKPSSQGAESATLYVSSNAATGPATIALTGTGTAPVIVLSVSSTSATVSSGGSATYTITQQALPGVTGSASFTCTDLPLYAACSFSPANLPLTSGGSTTLTVTTTQTMAAAVHESLRIVAGAISIAGMLLVPLVRRRRSWPLLFCCVLTLALAGISGCGGSKAPSAPAPVVNTTPKGSYTFHVTASSAAVSQTIALSLTVQ